VGSENDGIRRRQGGARHLVGLLLAALVAVGDGAPPLSADAIFDRARAAVAARPLPPYIAYTTYAAFLRKGHTKAEHLRVVLRTSDGHAYVTPVPDSPADRIDTTPYVAVKPPYFWPTTTFGLVPPRAVEGPSIYEDPASATPASSGPAVIGSVKAVTRDYDVTLVGEEMLDGANVYDLITVPRSDPSHHRIRAMFVDTQTYEPRRIVMQAYAGKGPIHVRPLVTLDYAPFGPTWLIARGTTDVVVRITLFAYGGGGEFRLSDVSFPDTEPDWMFDRDKLRAHH
jgi:hypothetical protein